MRVRTLLVLGLTAILAGSVVACNGGSDSSSQQPLGARDFKDKVAAAIVTGTDLEAQSGFGLKVDVSQADGLDTLDLILADAYKQYRAAPTRQDQIVHGLVQDAVAQMEDGNSKRSFAEVRQELMPVLKRRSVVDQAAADLASTRFYDLDVVYAVQKENSFTVATKADVQRWGHSLQEIHQLALSNLERETDTQQKLLCEPSGGQKLCGWASGDGYDATRMLVPALRHQIVQKLGGPAVYAVPLESVFVALTRNYAPVIKQKVLQEFTTGKNPLSPALYAEHDGRLVALSS
jgi:uncharacterized protein YtpQ (UPF0354 family)